MKNDFQDLHVVVSGATGELGLAVAQALAARGAHLHLPARREMSLDAFDPSVRSRIDVRAGIDFGDEAAVASFYSDLPSVWASIHCAGAFAMQRIDDVKLEDWNKLASANVVSALVCTREAVKRMRGRGGRIVNVSAAAALEPRLGAQMATYVMTKAAIAALTAAVAEEVGGEGILVNAIAPSTMDTPANRRAMPTADFTRWAKLSDVANTIAFLASPENQVTRGAVVPVRGKS